MTAPNDDRAARLALVRAQRQRAEDIRFLRVMADLLRPPLQRGPWLEALGRLGERALGLPLDLSRALAMAAEDVELGEDGSAERARQLVELAADYLELLTD